MLAAALGVARNEHRQQAYVHDEKRQHHEGNRQVVGKPGIVAEHRPHHEGDEQDRDIGFEIALADRVGIARDQAAIRLSGIGGDRVHPSAGQLHKAARGTRPLRSPGA